VSSVGLPTLGPKAWGGTLVGWLGRWLLALLAGVLLVAVAAGPAAAHTTLLFADPAVGGAVPGSPTVITLVFDEPVTLGDAPVMLSDDRRQPIRLGPARSEQGDRVLAVPVTDHLTGGIFEVRWQVVAADGDPVGGDYRFGVGPATELTSTSSPPGDPQRQSPALVASSVLRWLLFAALSVALGGMVGARMIRSHAGPRRMAAPWTGRAAVAGVVAAVGLTALIAGAGDLWRGVSDPSLSTVAAALPGRLALLEVAGFAAAAILCRTKVRGWAWAPLLGVVAAEGLRSHAATALPGWGALLTGVHLLAAVIWVGALGQVVRTAVAWRSTPRRSWAAIGAYARLAGWIFAAVVTTGTGSALLLVPWGSWTTTGYGRALLVKLVLVILAAVLAVLARRRLRQGRRQTSGTGSSAPSRAARFERAVLVAVLAVTAVLVSLPAPAALGSSDLALPPPPSGVVVPLGTRAGMIGVSAAASTGQLVVHLSAPALRNTAQGAAELTAYHLGGTVSVASTDELTLTWRGCGPGCFVAPVTWGSGQNPVTLDVTADGWTGRAVTVTVPWPPHSGTQQLRGVVETMAQIPVLTVYERVTSDSGAGPGQARPLVMSGKDFLGVEPYGSGAAPQVALLGDKGGEVSLAVGFPGDLTQAELVIDGEGRLLRESLTAPNHWVTRSFVYPEP